RVHVQAQGLLSADNVPEHVVIEVRRLHLARRLTGRVLDSRARDREPPGFRMVAVLAVRLVAVLDVDALAELVVPDVRDVLERRAIPYRDSPGARHRAAPVVTVANRLLRGADAAKARGRDGDVFEPAEVVPGVARRVARVAPLRARDRRRTGDRSPVL